MRRNPIPEIEDMKSPFCGQRRRKKPLISLRDARPEVAEEWFYEGNAGWGPEHVSYSSSVRCWWQCPTCIRPYKAQVYNRTSNESACPYCTSHKVCEENSLARFYPELEVEWHPTKNRQKFTEMMVGSAERAFWVCKTCNHEWDCKIDDRTTHNSGCPACYRTRMNCARLTPKIKKAPLVLNADSKLPRDWYNPRKRPFRSVADYDQQLAKEWHPTNNGATTPHDFARGCDVVAWWKCSQGPDHEWQQTINFRTGRRKLSCPCCSNRKLSITNCLATISPSLAEEWHPFKNGDLTPHTAFARSTDYWWQCKDDHSHEWQASILRRLNGFGCIVCKPSRRRSGLKRSPEQLLENFANIAGKSNKFSKV